MRQRTSQPGTPLGVNVAGYLHAESGLGSAVRRYVQAIRAVNIPHALVDLSDLQANRSEDRSLTAGSGDLLHGVNVVVAGIDSHYAVVQKLGEDFFNDRYTVGVWAWELPRFPEKWFDRFAYFDEIWVGTSFIASTLAPIAPVPVIRMPPVLTVERSGSREAGRRRLGVPPDEFVFLFVFDVCSLLARKNPGAVIEAFARAFAPGEPVRLVLKCVNGSSAPDAMEKLSSAARALRVTILDGYWSADEMADLMPAADAYVSLHRSEGTGLTISDAMAHALPVVATGWSGSTDFLTPFTGFPVAYDLVALEQNVGPYARGEMWADPSIEHAAVLMRQVVNAPDAARGVGEAARRNLETSYSADAIGNLIRERLQAIERVQGFAEFRRETQAKFRRYQTIDTYLRAPVATLPPACVVLVASKGDPRLVELQGRTGWHFPRAADGRYAGYYPPDSAAAIEHLESLREQGAQFLLFPETAFWWLEHYDKFRQHLDGQHQCIWKDQHAIIYKLRSSEEMRR